MGDYVDRLFTWIEDQLNDERIFPTTLEAHFPANFKQRVSRIFRRLFRVYAHIYYSHFEYIIQQVLCCACFCLPLPFCRVAAVSPNIDEPAFTYHMAFVS